MTATIPPGFLADILEHPADDAPRLILADWLDGEGQHERAEFIRVQCELAQKPSVASVCRAAPTPCHRCLDCEAWFALRCRERELLDAHIGLWTGDMPEQFITRACPHCEDGVTDWETGVVECRRCESTGVIPDFDRVEFTRGFVSSVRLALDDWQKYGALLVRHTPLERVEMTGRGPATCYRPSDEQGQGSICKYLWVSESQEPELWAINAANRLPDHLYNLLDEQKRREGWESREDAATALSEACLLWAQQQPLAP